MNKYGLCKNEKIVKTFKQDPYPGDVHIIFKAPNGKYFNRYEAQDPRNNKLSIGPYSTIKEAKVWLLKHRPGSELIRKVK